MRLILTALALAYIGLAIVGYQMWRQQRAKAKLDRGIDVARDEAVAALEADLGADDVVHYLRPERRAEIEELLRKLRRD